MNLELNNAVNSDYSNITDYSVSAKTMDSPTGNGETTYTIENASELWGLFLNHGDTKSAITMKAIWNVGKGWTCKSRRQQVILERIDGWGKETFDDVLFNMEISRRIFGDAFAEIIRDDDGNLLNLKPLFSGDIKIIVDAKGRIKQYQSLKNKNKTFKPQDIFHLCNNRIGDQIHGISDVEIMKSVITADEQSFADLQKVISFQAKPFIIFKMKTDDQTQINNFVTKVRLARQNGDDMFIPDDENLLSYEVVQVNPSSILMDWRDELRNKFYRIVGMPLILFGSSGSTESGGKIEYTGHEQIWEHDQR